MFQSTPLPSRLTIGVALIGSLRPRLDAERLRAWRSMFFQLTVLDELDDSTLPEPKAKADGYRDRDFDAVFPGFAGFDLSIAIIDAPLDEGYYMRRLSGNRVILSVYDVAPLLIAQRYRLDTFVYRNIYQIMVAYRALQPILPTTATRKLAHTSTRGCLFDWNDKRDDILNSLDRPGLCRICRARYFEGTDLALWPWRLSVELARIRRPAHLRLLELVRNSIDRRPWLSLAVAVAIGVGLNLVASYMFEWLKVAPAWKVMLPTEAATAGTICAPGQSASAAAAMTETRCPDAPPSLPPSALPLPRQPTR